MVKSPPGMAKRREAVKSGEFWTVKAWARLEVKMAEELVRSGRYLAAIRKAKDDLERELADKLAEVRKPFVTTKEKGTGLGLSVSHGTIEAHRGTIEVSSEVGEGTEFRICLPTRSRKQIDPENTA